MRLTELRDISQGEKVEAELDAFVSRRDKQRREGEGLEQGDPEAELAKAQAEWLSFDEIVEKSKDIDEAMRLASEQEAKRGVADKVRRALQVRRLKGQLAEEKEKLGSLHADTSRRNDELQEAMEKEREAKAARGKASGQLGLAQGVLYSARERIRRLEKQVSDLEEGA